MDESSAGVLVESAEGDFPVGGTGYRGAVDLDTVGEEPYGYRRRSRLLRLFLVLPELDDFDVDLLGIVRVDDQEAFLRRSVDGDAVSGRQIGLLDGVLDLLAVSIPVKFVPGVLPAVGLAQLDGFSDSLAVSLELYVDRLRSEAVAVVVISPLLLDVDRGLVGGVGVGEGRDVAGLVGLGLGQGIAFRQRILGPGVDNCLASLVLRKLANGSRPLDRKSVV